MDDLPITFGLRRAITAARADSKRKVRRQRSAIAAPAVRMHWWDYLAIVAVFLFVVGVIVHPFVDLWVWWR